MTITDDYRTLRSTVGVHSPTAPLVRITGDDRLAFLDSFMSRSSDFVDPDTARECLTLSADGTPFAIMLHLEREGESWLLPRTSLGREQLAAYFELLTTDGDVEIEISPVGWGAVAFEGPLAWQVAADFVDYDIAGLTLHAITDVVVPGADAASTAWLARVGTTGEYGYLLVSDCPDLAGLGVLGRAESMGGSEITADALSRVQAEAGMPHYAMGVDLLSAAEADLAWLIDWKRVGEFYGSENLVEPRRDQRRLVPVISSISAKLKVGDVLRVGTDAVGRLVYRVPAANPAEQLAFAVVEAPYWVPSLPLSCGRDRVLTVSLPRVVSRSSLNRIG